MEFLFLKERLLSTSGIVPEIQKCGTELGVNLAISLHAVNDELRNILVPINKKYNIENLITHVKTILHYLIQDVQHGSM